MKDIVNSVMLNKFSMKPYERAFSIIDDMLVSAAKDGKFSLRISKVRTSFIKVVDTIPLPFDVDSFVQAIKKHYRNNDNEIGIYYDKEYDYVNISW